MRQNIPSLQHFPQKYSYHFNFTEMYLQGFLLTLPEMLYVCNPVKLMEDLFKSKNRIIHSSSHNAHGDCGPGPHSCVQAHKSR